MGKEERLDFDNLDDAGKEKGKDHDAKSEDEKLPDLDDVIDHKDSSIDMGAQPVGGEHGQGHDKHADIKEGSTMPEQEGSCDSVGAYTPTQPDFGLDDTGNFNNG